jgi:flagellar motor protein MotB
MGFVVTTTVDNYGDHEFDFQTALTQLGDSSLVDQLVSDLVAAEMEQSGKFVTVTIVGHSDRNDTPGLSPDDRRADELDFSSRRGINALNWLLDHLQTGVQEAGGTVPIDWDSARFCSATLTAAGAAALAHPVPANTGQRAENRRVDLVIMQLPL